jgi:drug/metabolite transporter (DMT)-like permease
MMKNFLLIFFSVTLAVCGQLSLKNGMLKIGFISLDPNNLPMTLLKALLSPFVFLGLCLFFISALSWLVVLSRVELSWAYPMVAMGYIVTVFLSWLLFKENVTLIRIIGCSSIALGVILISRS